MVWFDESKLTSKVALTLVPQCGKCKLYKGCESPFMKPTGRGKKRILVLGEAPGQNEDLKGRQFVGKTGRLLRETLEEVGIDPNRDCTLTNALICWPGEGNVIRNKKSIEWCRPNIIQTINEVEPEVILLVGYQALRSLIPYVWKDDVGPSLTKWVDHHIPCQKLNAWLCPIYHPSYISREENRLLDRMWKESIDAACNIKGRPWKKVPNWIDKVEVMFSPKEAADFLDTIDSENIAFDIETNMLKPDSKDAEIICCSVSNGKRTVCFPWQGRAIKAMCRIFASKRIGKYGWNQLKMEFRWLMRMGYKVRNWSTDGMLASYALDNRRGSKSLKFRSFVHLGQPDYDEEIKPYLKSDGNNSKNRIREADQGALMRYCGLDSLLTYRLCEMKNHELKEASGE